MKFTDPEIKPLIKTRLKELEWKKVSVLSLSGFEYKKYCAELDRMECAYEWHLFENFEDGAWDSPQAYRTIIFVDSGNYDDSPQSLALSFAVIFCNLDSVEIWDCGKRIGSYNSEK